MLAHFHLNIETGMQTDASDYALGAVLCHLVQQVGKRIEKPICCTSQTIDTAQANYSVTEKCLALAWLTDLFHTLLLGH